MAPQPWKSSAFSLIELLVVMSIIGTLVAFSAKSLISSSSSDHKMALTRMIGLLDNARETAIAHNTYTYIGFTTPTDPSNSSTPLCVAMFQSSSGVDSLRQALSGSQALLQENQNPGSPGSWRLLTRPVWLRHEILQSTTEAPVTLLPEEERIQNGFSATINPLATGFSIIRRIGDMPQGGTLLFDRIVTFAPNGTVFVNNRAGVPTGTIGVLLKPCRGSAPSSKEEAQVAAIVINGLLGSSQIYQNGSAK